MATTAVVVGTAKAVGGAMDNAGQQKAAAQQQAAAAAAAQQQQVADLQTQQASLAAQQEALAQQQAAAAAAPAGDGFDAQLIQIQKLSALKDQGVLTEEEFQAKKRQILGI
jgi:hypothetical protein